MKIMRAIVFNIHVMNFMQIAYSTGLFLIPKVTFRKSIVIYSGSIFRRSINIGTEVIDVCAVLMYVCYCYRERVYLNFPTRLAIKNYTRKTFVFKIFFLFKILFCNLINFKFIISFSFLFLALCVFFSAVVVNKLIFN